MKDYMVTIDFEPLTICVEAKTWEDALVAAHKEMEEHKYQPDDWWVGYAEDEEGNEVYAV